MFNIISGENSHGGHHYELKKVFKRFCFHENLLKTLLWGKKVFMMMQNLFLWWKPFENLLKPLFLTVYSRFWTSSGWTLRSQYLIMWNMSGRFYLVTSQVSALSLTGCFMVTGSQLSVHLNPWPCLYREILSSSKSNHFVFQEHPLKSLNATNSMGIFHLSKELGCTW